METKNFQSSISAEISAGEAIKRISKVPEWWGITFSGNSENQNDKFVVKMGGDSFFNFTVAELIPNKRVVWSVSDCFMPWYSDKKEWTDTKLIFDLAENNGVTTLHFTHEGLTPKVECYKDCETGWTHWIRTSLFSYFTTGKGQFKQRIQIKYTTAIEIERSPDVVFNYLIHDVSKFWPEEFEGESSRLNDEFVFTTGDKHYSKNKVIELVPNKKVVWLVIESTRKTDNFEWTGTKMIFELTSKDGNTILEFTYDGVVLENEYDRLTQLCDMVIKDTLCNLIIKDNLKTNLEMATKDFHTTIKVGASAEEAMKKISQVNQWWAKKVKGKTERLNDKFTVDFGETFVDFQITELIPRKKVVWKVTDCNLHWINDKKEWKGTEVVFEISDKKNTTQIDFTHVGLVPGVECYKDCETGWTGHVTESLVKFINEGKGSPE